MRGGQIIGLDDNGVWVGKAKKAEDVMTKESVSGSKIHGNEGCGASTMCDEGSSAGFPYDGISIEV